MDEQLFVLVWEEEDVRLSHSSELLESISVHGYVSTESAVIFQSFSWVFEVPIQHTYFWGVLGGGGEITEIPTTHITFRYTQIFESI